MTVRNGHTLRLGDWGYYESIFDLHQIVQRRDKWNLSYLMVSRYDGVEPHAWSSAYEALEYFRSQEPWEYLNQQQWFSILLNLWWFRVVIP